MNIFPTGAAKRGGGKEAREKVLQEIIDQCFGGGPYRGVVRDDGVELDDALSIAEKIDI